MIEEIIEATKKCVLHQHCGFPPWVSNIHFSLTRGKSKVSVLRPRTLGCCSMLYRVILEMSPYLSLYWNEALWRQSQYIVFFEWMNRFPLKWKGNLLYRNVMFGYISLGSSACLQGKELLNDWKIKCERLSPVVTRLGRQYQPLKWGKKESPLTWRMKQFVHKCCRILYIHVILSMCMFPSLTAHI